MSMTGHARLPNLTTVVASQLTVTDVAAPLAGVVGADGGSGLCYLQSDPSNTASSTIKLGDSGAQCWALAVGDAFPFPLPLANLSAIYALGSTTGLKLNVLILK